MAEPGKRLRRLTATKKVRPNNSNDRYVMDGLTHIKKETRVRRPHYVHGAKEPSLRSFRIGL